MVKIDQKLYEKMIFEIKQAAPREACGILGGRRSEGKDVVEGVYPRKNRSRSPNSEYFIAPEEALDVFEQIEERGQRVLGFYHSHSDTLIPSEQDYKKAYWEGYIYLIASPKERARVWRWFGGKFKEERLKIA